MRMLALVTDGFGATGGIAQYNRDLACALAQSGAVESIVIVPRFGTPDQPLPPRVTQIAALGDRFGWSAAATRIALSRRFDGIFCGHLFAAPLAAALAALIRKPLWLQLHGIEAWPKPAGIIRRAAERASLITSVSRHTRAAALRWCDIDPARLRVLPNTVDPRFAPGAAPPALRRSLGLEGGRVLLTVSRLSASERYKGHDRIIAALPRILERRPDTFYLVAGDGDDRARLEALAHERLLTDRVRFAGRVSAEDLPDYYRLADAFVMPSAGEGFGIAYLEALATGLQVVAGGRDGGADALADGALGALVDPYDERALIEAVVAALDGGAGAALAQRFAFANFAALVDSLVRHRL